MIPPIRLTRNLIFSQQASSNLHRVYFTRLFSTPTWPLPPRCQQVGLPPTWPIRWGSAQPAPHKKHICICTHLCFLRHTGKVPSSLSNPSLELHIHPVPTLQAHSASVRRHLLTANLSYDQCPSYRKPSVSASPLPSHQAETVVGTILHSSLWPSAFVSAPLLTLLCLPLLTITFYFYFAELGFWSANLLWPLCPA